MEKEFKNTGSVLDNCRICKCKLYVWEEDGAVCVHCIENFIEKTKKDYKLFSLYDK